MKNCFKLITAIALLTFWVNNPVYAGRGDKTKAIHTPEGGSPVIVGTPTAKDSIQLDLLGINQRDYNVKNRISFGVDMHYPEFVAGPQIVQVSVNVKRYDVSNNPLSDINVKLNIAYHHNDSVSSRILDDYEFSNAYRMVFRIDTIRVDGVITTTLPKNLFVQGDIFVERYTTLITTAMNPDYEFLDVDCDGVSDGVTFFWPAVQGAEEYQLEFLHISNYGSDSTVAASSSLKYNFRNNSTRVTTSAPFYDIALLFDRGWIAYRVRSVGVDIDNPDHLIFGDWSTSVSGTINTLSAPNKIEITDAEVHETALNWQYSATYAEQGKRKEVITYYDGTLRNRQAVTKVNTENNVIVGETFYDHQGRPTVTALPTPVEFPSCEEDAAQPIIKYYPEFNVNSQGQAYSKADFDLSSEGDCSIVADSMSTSSGASRYYSPANPNKNLHQAYVPDANGYPFQHVQYTSDNSGRINRQGGVGPDFQIGGGHETKYLYGNANQLELNRMFGSEVGYEKHYQKNSVIDANGQVSVSYVDMAGRVIATALAGDAPGNVTPLESPAFDTLEINHILPDGSNQTIDRLNNSVTFTSSFTISSPTEVFVDYKMLTIPLIDTCLTDICVDCVYELELSLKDDCGADLLPDTLQNRIVGNFQLDSLDNYVFHAHCTDSTVFNPQFSVDLTIGKYTIAKKLTIKEEAIYSYLNLIDSSNCVLSYQDFLNAEMQNIDSASCMINCDNCLEQLGTLEAYISNGHGTSGEYYARVQECLELCETRKTDCELYHTMMQIDMSPGGQYGEYINASNGAINLNFPLSIYNSSNVLPAGANWRAPILHTPYGTQTIYANEAGERSKIYLSPTPDNSGDFIPAPLNNSLVQYDAATDQYFIYPEQLLSVEDFIDYFEQSWALSLVTYHPEYCYYESCIMYEEKHAETDAFSSSSFDLLLMNTNTFLEAQARGFITPSGTPSNWFVPNGSNPTDSVKPWDPFVYYHSDFEIGSCGGLGAKLVAKYNQFNYQFGQWYSMAQIAAYTARCGSNFPAVPAIDCYSFGQLYNGVMDTTILNQEWGILKALYMSAKQGFQQDLANCKAMFHCEAYNECIGDDEYFPFSAFATLIFTPSAFIHPLWNPDQPCSIQRFLLYRNKTKRFATHKDAMKEDANSTAYELYLQTGQCPNAFALQKLLNELAQQNHLTAAPFNLNTTGYLSALFQANNSYYNPGAVPTLEYNAVTTTNTITADWTDVANSSVFATLTLNKTAPQSWSQVTGIINLFATGAHTFTAEATYNDYGDTINPVKVFSIDGTMTYFELEGCTFEQECKSNQLALDLTTIFNVLITEGAIAPGVPVGLVNYASSTLGSNINLTSLYIENAANSGSNLSLVLNGANTSYRIYNPSLPGNDGLYIQILETSGTLGSSITLIEPMISMGNYSFEMTAHQSSGYPITFSGVMYQIHNGDTIGISAGDCSLPTPNKCQGQAYEVFEDLKLLLQDVLINYDGSSDINLYSSIYTTPAIVSALPYGETQTTSIDRGDSLIISAGDYCDLLLVVDSAENVQFENLVGISNFEINGEPNMESAYNVFTFSGEFETPGGIQISTVVGFTCFSIKQCNPCSDSASATGGILRYAIPLDTAEFAHMWSTPENAGRIAAREHACTSVFHTYQDCEEEFYTTHGYYALDWNMDSLYYFNSCKCLDELCTYISTTNFAGLGLTTVEARRVYVKNTFMCAADSACLESLDQLNDCIEWFNDQEHAWLRNYFTPTIIFVPIPTFTFANIQQMNWCGCVDLICSAFERIVNDGITFYNYESLFEYLNFACHECSYTYESYTYCFNNFVSNYEGPYNLNPANIVSFENFRDQYGCDGCVDMYCELLNTVLTENIQFSSQEELDSTLTLNADCEVCLDSYTDYTNAISAYNSDTHTYTITPMERSFFIIGGYCNCVKEYTGYLNRIIDSSMTFNNETEFLNYVSLARICGNEQINEPENPCDTAYDEYFRYTYQFVANNPTDFTLNYIPRSTFDSLGLCNCVHQYVSALHAVYTGLVTFSTQQDFDTYVFGKLNCKVTPPCTPAPSTGVTPEMPNVELENDCIAVQVNLAIVNAQNQYNMYMDRVKTVYRQKYLDHCLSTQEHLYTTYSDKQHHYTLYYYDNAGNLIKTIPPEGVELMPFTSTNDPLNTRINNDRSNGTKTVFTSHRLQTRYEYNSLNQLVAQYTPDTDPIDVFEQTLPNGLHQYLQTNKIQMLNGSVGYLAGEIDTRGYLYKTTDGGETWSRMHQLVAADLKKVTMLTNNFGVAIGENGTVLKTVDGGSNWDMVITWNTTGMITTLNDIAVINPTSMSPEIMFVGDNGLTARSTTLLNPTPSFTVIPGPVGNVLSVEVLNNEFYCTAYDETEGISRFYHYASSAWTEIKDVRNNTFSDVHLYAPNKAYAVDMDGRIYANTDVSNAQTKWIHRSSNLNQPIHQIRFFDEQQGIALVEDNGDSKLYRTIDGAKTWTIISDDAYTAIAIDKDIADSAIVAVGKAGKMAVIFPYSSGTDGYVDVNTPQPATDFTAVWLERNGANMHIVASDNQTIYYTQNALTQNPVWFQNNYSSVGSKFLRLEAAITSGNIYGVGITASGQAWRLLKTSTPGVILGTSFSGTGYADVTVGNTYFYLSTTAGTTLQRADISTSTTLTSAGTLTYAAHRLTTRFNYILATNGTGNINHLILTLPQTLIASQFDHTEKVYPDKINVLTTDASTNKLLAFGNDGLAYHFDGTDLFTHISNAVNEHIYDAYFINSQGGIVGQNGLIKGGAIIGFNYMQLTDASTPSGQNISEAINYTDLHAMIVTPANRVYAVGKNGTLIYSPHSSLAFVNVLNMGNISLNGISNKIGSNSVVIVGENGYIQEQIGAMPLVRKELFIPPITDIHFRNASEGTIVSKNFVVRSTVDGGGKWKVARPQGAQNPSETYKKVWTLQGGKFLLFGNGNTLVHNRNTGATITAFTSSNVRAVAKGTDPSNIYIVDNNQVRRINVSNISTSTVHTYTGSTAVNALHVFPNGDHMIVGDAGLFKHFGPTGVMFFSSVLPSVDLNDIAFKDNINGIIVGDGGTYYYTINHTVSPSGYLTGTLWQSRNLSTTEPLNVINANIYTIAVTSSVDILIGGVNPPAYANVGYPYFRKIYDAGGRYSNRFYYDRLGRLVVSRNARQEAESKYSYTLYDALGRVVEAGEKTENNGSDSRFNSIFGTIVSGHYNPITIDDTKLNSWVAGNGDRKEVTRSYYDEVTITGLPAVIASDHTTQRHRIVHVTYEETFDGDDQTYDHATHYRYDIHGNVNTLLQDNKKMAESFPSIAAQQFKRMDYSYDLLSGNVHRMSVQNGEADQWHHAYKYDADNRIKNVYTNTRTPLTDINRLTQNKENELTANSDWQNDAQYYYYDHGPLARVEIGQNNLQGVDYYYNLQGWLKGVNSSVLEQANDPGKDGVSTGPVTTNALFAKDVVGFGLQYYQNDYTAIASIGSATAASVNGSSHAASNSADLYNGNIRYMQTSITNPNNRDNMPMLNAYKYDQLNRLVESRSYETGLSSNSWNPTTYGDQYFNHFDYDAIGNIRAQSRHKRDGTAIERLKYKYQLDENSNLLRNRLYHVHDFIGDAVDDTDIDDMGYFFSHKDSVNVYNNYVYDAEGRLVKDRQEEIDTIIWRVDGKVKEIRRTLTSEKKNLIFDYNSFGQRIAKHVHDNQTDLLEQSTYYILDAQGNQLAMYEHRVDTALVKYYLAERNIYGSSRLGMTKDSINMYDAQLLPSYGVTGNRNYELNNHLGNVLTVINDHVFPLSDDNTTIDGYQVGIMNTYDYSPFGVQLDGRTLDRTFQVCTGTTTTDTIKALEEGFGTWFTWTTMGNGLITYVSGEMQVSNPNNGARNIGASKQFNVGEGLHKVNFDIIGNTCATIVLWPPSSTPKTINVYIRDNANNIVASGNYTTAGSYSLSFTPSSSGTYKIEFYMANANAFCFFRVDNVLITYVEEVSTMVCNEVTSNYRYGFQAQEKDDEVSGAGNSVNYMYRMHNARLGRFMAIDPLTANYPHYSPYSFSGNKVIAYVELEGKEEKKAYVPPIQTVPALTVAEEKMMEKLIQESLVQKVVKESLWGVARTTGLVFAFVLNPTPTASGADWTPEKQTQALETYFAQLQKPLTRTERIRLSELEGKSLNLKGKDLSDFTNLQNRARYTSYSPNSEIIIDASSVEEGRNLALNMTNLNPLKAGRYVGRLGEGKGKVTGLEGHDEDGNYLRYRYDIDTEGAFHINVEKKLPTETVKYRINLPGGRGAYNKKMKELNK